MGMTGVEFQPQAEPQFRKTLNNGASGAGPNASEVLKVLSLRLPQVLGGRPIAPAGLLTANPSPGPQSAVLSSLGASGAAPVAPGSGGAPGVGGAGSPIQQMADAIPSIAQLGGNPGAPRINPGDNNAERIMQPTGPTPSFKSFNDNEAALGRTEIPSSLTPGGGMNPLVTMLQHFFPQGK